MKCFRIYLCIALFATLIACTGSQVKERSETQNVQLPAISESRAESAAVATAPSEVSPVDSSAAEERAVNESPEGSALANETAAVKEPDGKSPLLKEVSGDEEVEGAVSAIGSPEHSAVHSNPPVRPDYPEALHDYLPAGNERLDYEVGFLWFDRLADGALLLEKLEGEGHYRATLEVRTRGMAALFTRNRRERYESHMQLGDDGYFLSRSFVTRRYKGKGENMTDRGKALFFDTRQGTVVYQRSKNGKLTDDKQFELPKDQEIFDFLCAYWNLRLGMFGPLTPGARLILPSYSFKGASDIVVEVLEPQERAGLKDFPVDGTLCRLYLDEELFETGGGKLYVWFNEARQPGKGIVVDVLGLGDVHGTMVRANNFVAPPIPLQVIEKPIHIEGAN